MPRNPPQSAPDAIRVERDTVGVAEDGPIYGDGNLARGLVSVAGDPTEAIHAIEDLYQYSVDQPGAPRRGIVYRIVNDVEARAFKEKTGIDVAGYQHVIDSYGIRHSMRNHGTPETEEPRGQVPITVDDFRHIGEVTRPENIVRVSQKRGMPPMVEYEMDAGDYVIVGEEVRSKRRHLALQTIYKRKKGEGGANRASMTPGEGVQSHNARSDGRDSSSPTGTVPPNRPLVKSLVVRQSTLDALCKGQLSLFPGMVLKPAPTNPVVNRWQQSAAPEFTVSVSPAAPRTHHAASATAAFLVAGDNRTLQVPIPHGSACPCAIYRHFLIRTVPVLHKESMQREAFPFVRPASSGYPHGKDRVVETLMERLPLNGGKARPCVAGVPTGQQRCQARCKATGTRCGRWANTGSAVCAVHGAGTKHRPGGAGNRRKPGGRPPTTGLWSARLWSSLADIRARYKNDPGVTNALEHLAHACALRERAENMLAATEAELLQQEASGDLTPRAEHALSNRMVELQAHLCLISNKASAAQDRWHKQTHGEKYSFLGLPELEAIMAEVDRTLEKYVDAGKVDAARTELAAALNRLDGGPQPVTPA